MNLNEISLIMTISEEIQDLKLQKESITLRSRKSLGSQPVVRPRSARPQANPSRRKSLAVARPTKNKENLNSSLENLKIYSKSARKPQNRKTLIQRSQDESSQESLSITPKKPPSKKSKLDRNLENSNQKSSQISLTRVASSQPFPSQVSLQSQASKQLEMASPDDSTLYFAITNYSKAQRLEILDLVNQNTNSQTILKLKFCGDAFDSRLQFLLNLSETPKRTMTFLASLVNNSKIKILNQHSITWLKNCLRDNKILDYGDFLLKNYRVNSILNQHLEIDLNRDRRRLLAGYKIYLNNELKMYRDLKKLVGLLGGQISGEGWKI